MTIIEFKNKSGEQVVIDTRSVFDGDVPHAEIDMLMADIMTPYEIAKFFQIAHKGLVHGNLATVDAGEFILDHRLQDNEVRLTVKGAGADPDETYGEMMDTSEDLASYELALPFIRTACNREKITPDNIDQVGRRLFGNVYDEYINQRPLPAESQRIQIVVDGEPFTLPLLEDKILTNDDTIIMVNQLNFYRNKAAVMFGLKDLFEHHPEMIGIHFVGHTTSGQTVLKLEYDYDYLQAEIEFSDSASLTEKETVQKFADEIAAIMNKHDPYTLHRKKLTRENLEDEMAEYMGDEWMSKYRSHLMAKEAMRIL